MAHLLFDALNGVTLDNQAALTVQSLLESQGLSSDGPSGSTLNTVAPSAITLDEEDVFQCGKCKKQFTSFSLFMSHKKEHTAAGSPIKLGGGELSLSLDGELSGQREAAQVEGPTDSTGYPQLQVHALDNAGTPTELGQPIILSDADILSFSIDQGALNIASSSQVMPSLSNVIQNGAFLTSAGESVTSGKALVGDGTVPTSSSFNVTTLTGQPIILTSSQLVQGTSFMTSALSDIQSITSPEKPASLQSIPSNKKDVSIVAMYPNRIMKGCKVLLPNIDYIDRSMDSNKTILLNCGEDLSKKSGKVVQYEESSLDTGTVLLDYSGDDTRRSCKVLMPNVQYTEANIEFIDDGEEGQDAIVEYSSVEEAQSAEEAMTVSLLDVVQPADTAVTLNLSKAASTDGKLQCDYCNKMFAKNFDLQQHMRSHTGEKPFQCVVCGRAFSQKSNVKKHITTHKVWPNGLSRTLPKDPLHIVQKDFENSTVKPDGDSSTEKMSKGNGSGSESSIMVVDKSYVCQYCSAVFSSYFEWKTHMKQHSHEKVYRCIQKNCHQTFSDLDAFLEHTSMHSTEVQYCCHVCSKQFSTLADLGIHQYTHSAFNKSDAKLLSRVFPCVKCKSKFTSAKALDLHLSTTNHNYPCPHCGKVFTCERYLRRHLHTHGAPESFTCPQCGKGFRTEHYLNTHRIIHSGERPYSCQNCPASFNRKDKLVRHSLIHQPVKKYKCPFHNYLGCSKEFNRQDKLKLHILTHSAVKPYQCKKCSKTFLRLTLLREHERTQHSADSPFSCQHCGTHFRKKFQLSNHTCSAIEGQQNTEQSVKKDSPATSGRRLGRQQSRGRNLRKVRGHRRVANAESTVKSAKKPVGAQPEGDNVPTIEIIVMPVTVDQREEGEQGLRNKGVYHVMYPGNAETDPSVITLETDPSVITFLENGSPETVTGDISEGEVLTSNQEVQTVRALRG